MKTLNEKDLEQLIHSTLRSLPDRRAPGTLEARVLAEVERRATIAWYHKSWSYWPAAGRAAFLCATASLCVAIVVGFYLLSRGESGLAVAHEVGSRFQILSQLYATGTWVVDLVGRQFASIPSIWLYGGLGLVAALYATFLGLGAVAYRTLYQHE